MKTKTWIIAGAAAVALVALVAWVFAPKPIIVEFAPVTQGAFETTIEEDGKTRLIERYVVSAPLAGRMARISLKEGDAVALNTPLVQLSAILPTMLDARTVRELGARVESARDNVARTNARLARAQVSRDQAKSDLRRSEQLAQQGFIAAAKVQADRLAEKAAQREVQVAEAERRMATHELEQAQAAVSAVAQLSKAADANSDAQAAAGNAQVDTGNAGGFTVRAPIAGRVLRVLQTSEGAVAFGTPLIEIGDTQHMEIVAELLSTDALQAKPGSRVMIERWGGVAILEGQVRSVEPAAFTKVSALGVEEQRVRVLIDITSPQANWQVQSDATHGLPAQTLPILGDGYRVSVRIVTLAENKAIQVPVSAVFPLPAEGATSASGRPLGEARYAVFVAEAGRAKQVPITLGARNGSAAWIRSGLAVGQQVIVYPPATVQDGQRVAERKR